MSQRSADFEEMVRDIAERLRSVCGHLCEEEFLSLVESIAQTKRRFLLRDDAEAILTASGLGTGSNLARPLRTIPRVRPLSSVPPSAPLEPPPTP